MIEYKCMKFIKNFRTISGIRNGEINENYSCKDHDLDAVCGVCYHYYSVTYLYQRDKQLYKGGAAKQSAAAGDTDR